jgi:hypothetical protein
MVTDHCKLTAKYCPEAIGMKKQIVLAWRHAAAVILCSDK